MRWNFKHENFSFIQKKILSIHRKRLKRMKMYFFWAHCQFSPHGGISCCVSFQSSLDRRYDGRLRLRLHFSLISTFRFKQCVRHEAKGGFRSFVARISVPLSCCTLGFQLSCLVSNFSIYTNAHVRTKRNMMWLNKYTYHKNYTHFALLCRII